MTSRVASRPALMLAAVLACACLAGALRAQPAGPKASEADRAFVKKTLAALDENDPSTADQAEKALVGRGAGLIPALAEALPAAQGLARRAIDSALVRLEWKLDAVQLIRESVGKLPDYVMERMNPVLVSDESLARAFPDRRFYAVIIRQYPVAVRIPEPLKDRNLFVLSRDGKVQHLVDGGALTGYFVKNLGAVQAERDVKDAVVSWLDLSKEFEQDGMFRFKPPIEDPRVEKRDGGWLGTGRLLVDPVGGNFGSIGVTMTFDAQGKLSQVKQIQNIRPGVRPICQASRLLDPDPVVRRMAEQDLLVMGSAARDYVFEQRAKASPELQREIDRVWQLILERERARETPVPAP